MLNEIKEYWFEYEFETYRYQNRCKVLKGWVDLFTHCDDHISSLDTLKMS